MVGGLTYLLVVRVSPQYSKLNSELYLIELIETELTKCISITSSRRRSNIKLIDSTPVACTCR